MAMPNLIIGGVTIPHLAALEMTQEYSEVASVAEHRMGDGSLKIQRNWAKKGTTISGSGWIPAAFDSVDWEADVVIKCIAPEAVQGASNVLTIPTSRRDDTSVWGVAIVSGREVPTSVSMAGDTATLGAVSGASLYIARYYPMYTMRARPPRRTLNRSNATYDWVIEAQQT
jgi:hypothetical protein